MLKNVLCSLVLIAGCAHKEPPPAATAPTTPPPPAAESAKASEPEVVVTDKALVIHHKVQFTVGKADLLPESDTLLKAVADALRDHPDITLVEIQGYTSADGTSEANHKLSQERANSVRAWLVKNGVATERLSTKGYGKEAPLADNSSDDGREKNRRVEFKILKHGK